jgi:hypothetical protein
MWLRYALQYFVDAGDIHSSLLFPEMSLFMLAAAGLSVHLNFRWPSLATMLLGAAFCALYSARVDAQSSTADSSETAYCLGFAFGTWTPALDLKEAGHNPVVDTAQHPHAPGGRDWALSGPKVVGDSEIFLLPIWWPAGVVITLEHAPRSIADTVHGKALALVADGRKTPPSAVIRAWEKRCGG